MIKEHVDGMMERYLEHSARCAYLDGRITEVARAIQKAQSETVEDMISITARMTGMPGAQEGTSDPTGRVGLLVASGHKTPHVVELEAELDELIREHEQKSVTVIFVDAWLKVLDDKELFVIKKKTIGGLSWKQLCFQFRNTYGDEYSQQGLRKIRDTAMDKIYRVAE